MSQTCFGHSFTGDQSGDFLHSFLFGKFADFHRDTIFVRIFLNVKMDVSTGCDLRKMSDANYLSAFGDAMKLPADFFRGRA